MQNRLAVSGIPSIVPRLPNAANSIRELIEEHGCWVDRFAFLVPSSHHESANSIVAAAELHLENVRDDAVRSIDGLVVLDEAGVLLSAAKSSDDSSNSSQNHHCRDEDTIRFITYAAPATPLQSKQLIQQSPIDSEDDDLTIALEKQTLTLPINKIKLTVRSSLQGGGTGSKPWRGGLLLSHQICHWYQQKDNAADIDFCSLFHDKTILELGAGCSGLPSMTLAKIDITSGCGMSIISSDGIDEIVDALRVNVTENDLQDCVDVRHVDWNDYCIKGEDPDEDQEPSFQSSNEVDTILFADCIYNENCAIALSNTISRLIKPGGRIIGVLPDNRVGVDVFMKRMSAFSPKVLAIHNDSTGVLNEFATNGGGWKKYRLVLFSVGDHKLSELCVDLAS
jgi:predicted nicotinamide N-methyase